MGDVVEDRHANEPDEESGNSPANDDHEVEEAKVEETVKDTPSAMENRTTWSGKRTESNGMDQTFMT